MEPIEVKDHFFALHTEHTSYLFCVDQYLHLEHIHYGASVDISDAQALRLKNTVPYGDSVTVDEEGRMCLDLIPLEWSGNGRGDYRPSPISCTADGSTTSDFLYDGYDVILGDAPLTDLPSPYGATQTLVIHLTDNIMHACMNLYYAVYPEADVIARWAEIINNGGNLVIDRMMSYSLDMNEDDLVLMTFKGQWAGEAHLTETEVVNGTYASGADHGFSSSACNPGFLLRKKDTSEEYGQAWGFNLMWSGSHHEYVSMDELGCVRIMSGVSDDRLTLTLHKGESFTAPAAVMTYSDQGLNDLSHHFHRFVNEHVVRGSWKEKERPILINSWEGFYFDFTEEKILKLASQAKDLGIELFVLDDGWFGKRNDDRAGLGDYNTNLQKLPHGIRGLSDRIHDLDMKFGLWFEPEAVNPDSDLYRRHPEWAMHDIYPDAYGRHEFLLDLTNREVQEYIIAQVSKVLDEGNIDYVKWDMNRQMAGQNGAYDIAYLKVLYHILDAVFTPRPQILFESCSSGGNRFDLGMMCYSPQIWGSDDTDPVERLDIQKGYSYLYPQSTWGAHVSMAPHDQTMRDTPLSTRFHVAAYGQLGYELNTDELNETEKEEIKGEIIYYKAHRYLFQYGTFDRTDLNQDKEQFTVRNEIEAVSTKYRRLVHAAPKQETLRVMHLDGHSQYEVTGRSHILFLHPRTAAMKQGRLTESREGVYAPEENYQASGNALKQGIRLPYLFNGYFTKEIRIPGDFGSEMYYIKKIEK